MCNPASKCMNSTIKHALKDVSILQACERKVDNQEDARIMLGSPYPRAIYLRKPHHPITTIEKNASKNRLAFWVVTLSKQHHQIVRWVVLNYG
jgi:hypothetical protein